MTAPQLPPEQRQLADEIFRKAFKRATSTTIVVSYGVAFSVLMLVRAVFHHKIPGGFPGGLIGGVGVAVIMFPFPAFRYATRQLHKAGLSLEHQEVRSIPRTAGHFEEKPLVIYSERTKIDGWSSVAVALLLIALLAWHQRGDNAWPLLLTSVGFLLLTAGLLQALYRLSSPPLLRLDERGVFNGAQHLLPQHVMWAHIREAEHQRSFNYKGELVSNRLIFHNSEGRDVRVLFLESSFSTRRVDKIVAEVEARLSGEGKISDA